MKKYELYKIVSKTKIILICMVIVSSFWGFQSYAEDGGSDVEVLYSTLLQEKLFDNTDNFLDAAEGYDLLNGLWKVGAIDYDYNNNPSRNMIIDVNDVEAIADMYDGNFISFFADGTFVYANPVFHEGTYTAHPKNEGCFILKTEHSYRYSVEDGEVKKIDVDGKPNYYLEICDDSLHFQDYDPFTGKAKANDNGLYFVQIEDESTFIQNNKSELQVENSEKESSGSDGYVSTSSYSGILKTYTQKMENAVPQLVREYQGETSGVHDINQLAEICNDKVGELAEICNEGVGKMADLMYKNGDSYETYSDWAEKLMDNYIDIAQKIQDAYLESAM